MTKPGFNRLGLYDDVRRVLDSALESGGGQFTLPTHGAAVHWRQRAYQFRKLYAKIIAEDNSVAMSIYDRLTLPKIDPASTTVVINVRQIIGTFVPNAQPYQPSAIPTPGDELFDVAREIKDKISRGEFG